MGTIDNSTPFSHFPIKNRGKDGTGEWLVATFAAANTDTTFAIALGKIPHGYSQFRSSAPGVVYDGSQSGADWQPNSITLRASAIGTYTIRIS